MEQGNYYSTIIRRMEEKYTLPAKQKGLRATTQGLVTQIWLYSTLVMTLNRENKVMTIAHGGFITNSTVKAINSGLALFNLDGKCYIKKRTMYVKLNNSEFLVTNQGSIFSI
jgi:hypothetical protein